MKIVQETKLRDFEFWGKAIQVADCLTFEELDQIEEKYCKDKILPDYRLNNLFWIDRNDIAQYFGYENFKEMQQDRKDWEF